MKRVSLRTVRAVLVLAAFFLFGLLAAYLEGAV